MVMKDLNYFPMDVESNIYGMTTLEFDDKTSKVLVATLDCQIFCINYNKFKPHTREVEFTYIPSGAKIIAIGALKRGANDFVIGITHSLAPNLQKSSSVRSGTSFSGREGEYGKTTNYYLNIYASGSVTPNFDLDYVAQGCQTLRLRYVPYHLYQTELIFMIDSTLPNSKRLKRKPMWLLSGGDNCIHAFCEDRPYQSFNEIPIEECFPELNNIGGLALWIDVMNITVQDDVTCQRAVALGLEDGSIKLYLSALSLKTQKWELIRESSFDSYTTIIPSVRLFKIRSTNSSKLRNFLKLDEQKQDKALDQVNLLAVSTTNDSLVFKNVLESGLNELYELPESRRLDCTVASVISDTNFDGQNELLLGTHGRELLTYEYNKETESYQLAQTVELNHPVFAISVLDLTGDSLKEVIVLLTSGVLVMQASIRDVIEICKQRLSAILSLVDESN